MKLITYRPMFFPKDTALLYPFDKLDTTVLAVFDGFNNFDKILCNVIQNTS